MIILQIFTYFYLLIPSQAHADWVCDSNIARLNTEVGDEDADEVTVCGTAHNTDFNHAKAWALHEAHMEFWRVCMMSDTCKGYEVSIIPNRTECEQKKWNTGGYKNYPRWTCKRSFTFIINRSKRQCDERGKDMFRGCPMNKVPFDGI